MTIKPSPGTVMPCRSVVIGEEPTRGHRTTLIGSLMVFPAQLSKKISTYLPLGFPSGSATSVMTAFLGSQSRVVGRPGVGLGVGRGVGRGEGPGGPGLMKVLNQIFLSRYPLHVLSTILLPSTLPFKTVFIVTLPSHASSVFLN